MTRLRGAFNSAYERLSARMSRVAQEEPWFKQIQHGYMSGPHPWIDEQGNARDSKITILGCVLGLDDEVSWRDLTRAISEHSIPTLVHPRRSSIIASRSQSSITKDCCRGSFESHKMHSRRSSTPLVTLHGYRNWRVRSTATINTPSCLRLRRVLGLLPGQSPPSCWRMTLLPWPVNHPPI
jgi:hypothetical protein